MKFTRRSFLATGAAALPLLSSSVQAKLVHPQSTDDDLEKAAARPVFDASAFKDPVIIESIEVLRKARDRGTEYFVRVRSKDGAEGISVDDGRMDVLHPVLNRLVIPPFLGQDARNLEELIFAAYRYASNYKLQGLALWAPVALVEFAILDMLGRMAKKSIGELLGGVIRKSIPFYVASGRRDTTPEQEIVYLRSLVESSGAKAIKYRLGGRMSRNVDALPNRTVNLIPLSRKAFGDDMVIHTDANSSYDPPQAIEIGKRLIDINCIHYEEPCPFDNFDATRRVKDALDIPIALGEQESSHWRFQWMIRDTVADIVQPDLYYYGGMVRSTRVARMAELRNMATTVHLSGGFGFVYSLHFASCTPKIGPWQEYKQGLKTYGQWFDPPLRVVDGALTVPEGPGVGIADPKEILKGAEVVVDAGKAPGAE